MTVLAVLLPCLGIDPELATRFDELERGHVLLKTLLVIHSVFILMLLGAALVILWRAKRLNEINTAIHSLVASKTTDIVKSAEDIKHTAEEMPAKLAEVVQPQPKTWDGVTERRKNGGSVSGTEMKTPKLPPPE